MVMMVMTTEFNLHRKLLKSFSEVAFVFILNLLNLFVASFLTLSCM